MRKAKLEAYLNEFPFLEELIRESFPEAKRLHLCVTNIQVKRADENLLSKVPSNSLWTGSLGKSEGWEQIHFVLQNGNVLKNAVEGAEEYRSNYAHESEYYRDGESILDALSSLENPDDILYIVEEGYYYSGWSGGQEEEYYSIIIFKPPKGVKYSDLIAKAKARALAEVRAEADF